MSTEFQFRKGKSSIQTTKQKSEIEETQETNKEESQQPGSNAVQSLDSLDDYDFVDYLDHLSNVIQTQNDDLSPQDLDQSPNHPTDPKELSESSDPVPTLDPEESKYVGDRKMKSDDAIRISTFNPNGLPLKKLKD